VIDQMKKFRNPSDDLNTHLFWLGHLLSPELFGWMIHTYQISREEVTVDSKILKNFAEGVAAKGNIGLLSWLVENWGLTAEDFPHFFLDLLDHWATREQFLSAVRVLRPSVLILCRALDRIAHGGRDSALRDWAIENFSEKIVSLDGDRAQICDVPR
jgi:hypothetical protein